MRQLSIAMLIVTAALGGCAQTSSTGTTNSTDTTQGPQSAAPTSTSPTAHVPATGQPTSPTTPTPAAPTGTVLKTGSSEFGTMLYDRTGQAIYLFDRETGRRPQCYGACASAWPPVLTEGLPRGTGDVRAGLLGTTRREDGSTQVTYGNHPLYFYAHEGKNEVLCHDVSEFGGLWLVVTPNGHPAA